jgi:hypothetical protein
MILENRHGSRSHASPSLRVERPPDPLALLCRHACEYVRPDGRHWRTTGARPFNHAGLRVATCLDRLVLPCGRQPGEASRAAIS